MRALGMRWPRAAYAPTTLLTVGDAGPAPPSFFGTT
jgi:hypothetical protein